MINLISALLFSFSANLDNIVIGVSYGIKKIHISFSKNIIIAIFTSLFTFVSMYLGKYLSNFLSENIANIIGSSFLIAIGLFSIIKEYIIGKGNKKDDNGVLVEVRNRVESIRTKEMVTIILMLSLNNIAAGIAASVVGINILFTTICTFIFSCLFLLIGNKIGRNAINNKFIEKYSTLIASLILILLGVISI